MGVGSRQTTGIKGSTTDPSSRTYVYVPFLTSTRYSYVSTVVHESVLRGAMGVDDSKEGGEGTKEGEDYGPKKVI